MSETRKTQFQSLSREDPLEEENGNPLQYSYLKNSMDERNLVGYSPWGHKELDTIEHTHNFHRVIQQFTGEAESVGHTHTHTHTYL